MPKVIALTKSHIFSLRLLNTQFDGFTQSLIDTSRMRV